MAETKVGWVGIGVMGKSMCGHLLKAGCPVSLTTRTRGKASDLLAAGASREKILSDYPLLEAEDNTAALEYAARQSDHRVLHVA